MRSGWAVPDASSFSLTHVPFVLPRSWTVGLSPDRRTSACRAVKTPPQHDFVFTRHQPDPDRVGLACNQEHHLTDMKCGRLDQRLENVNLSHVRSRDGRLPTQRFSALRADIGVRCIVMLTFRTNDLVWLAHVVCLHVYRIEAQNLPSF